MGLTKDQRDALPDSDFAVPETRDLPMQDKTHTKMGWSMVDKTKGLSDEQRKNAKERLLKRAKEQGIDTTKWNVTAISAAFKDIKFNIEAMSVEYPKTSDHPNQVPFSGILTRIDEPSDEPVGGANGKRIVIPKDVAEKALKSLLLMAVDFTPSLDAHDSQKKIGIITEANIVGNAIEIKGFFYGADFPQEVKRIQAEKAKLGFSYEAQAQIRSENDDPWVLKSCVFTGAAILYKDKAAYQSTSLAANASEKSKMSEEILNLLKEMKASSEKEMLDMKKEIAEIKANSTVKEAKKVDAASLKAIVKPHADAIRGCADNLTAAGIGSHPQNGHAVALNKIADHLDAEASDGKLPHVYQTGDFYNAGADKKVEARKEVDDLKDLIASMKTEISDLKKKEFHSSEQPERKTVPLSAQSMHILKKMGMNPTEGEKLSVHELDAALDTTKANRTEAMALKLNLRAQGKLEGVQ